jgi:MbtH protein
MSTTPFDDEDGTFYALINDEGRYSCLDHIEQNRTEMRPRSLVEAMREAQSA